MSHHQLRSFSDPLVRLGFDSFFASAFRPHDAEGLFPGRVTVERRGGYVIATARGELAAELAGKLRHAASSRDELPAVGDWVALRPSPDAARAVIQAVLPRRSAFVRAIAGGTTEPQVVAANVDVVFLVTALVDDLNPRRIERYLSLARASGAEPVIVLTKRDLEASLDARLAEVAAVAPQTPVHAVSGLTGDGVDELAPYLAGHRTAALLGSSGVGKSTLVNRLVGDDVQAVGAVAADGRGKHTTTHRQLMLVPSGGLLLDTPGMRELRLWDDGQGRAGFEDTFADVSELSARCRFRDCAHRGEPGCAVQAALEEGALDHGRWSSFVKLERELASLEARKDARALADRKRAAKVIERARRARPDKRE